MAKNPENNGKTIILEFMDDKFAVPPGTKGIIQNTDDIGQIHVLWENGRTLAVVPEIDKYKILD